MATWLCNRCGASFPGPEHLERHREESHFDRERPRAPVAPHSAAVKPLEEGADAQDVRLGDARRERANPPEGKEDHPRGMTKGVEQAHERRHNPAPGTGKHD